MAVWCADRPRVDPPPARGLPAAQPLPAHERALRTEQPDESPHPGQPSMPTTRGRCRPSGATYWATSTPARPGSTSPRTPTRWPRGTTSSRGSAYRRSSAIQDRRSRIRTATAHGCSSSRCRRTRSPRIASTSTFARLPACRARSGWRRWRSSVTGSSHWERRGYVAPSPLPR